MDYGQITAKTSGVTVEQTSSGDIALIVLVGIVGLIVFFGILLTLVSFVDAFSGELRYLNMEIGRTEGVERRYYIIQRRRLWLSLLPFIRY